MSKKTQGSLEYIIIIGGIIIIAAATYFMLKGFSQTTSAGTTDQIGVAGDKFKLELENLGRSETRFLAKKWGSLPYFSQFTVNNTGDDTTATITFYNLTDYGLNLSELELAYNDSGEIKFLEFEASEPGDPNPTLNFTDEFENGTSDYFFFHNNSSADELDNLNSTSDNETVNVTDDGGPPVESPDTAPPAILISSEAYGTAGSVKDADIQAIVTDANSLITGVYYSIDNSPYFQADSLYYGYEGMTVEAHVEDNSYNSGTEIIHIIATVPSEDNYTIRVKAVDEYGNEGEKIQNVSITIGTAPPETTPPSISGFAFEAASPYQEGMLDFTATVLDIGGVAWCNLSVNNSTTVIVNTAMSVVSGTASASAVGFPEDLYTAVINCSDNSGNNNSSSVSFEVRELDTFSDGSASLNISFSSSNSSNKIELPKDSEVVNASLGLTGFVKTSEPRFRNVTDNYYTGPIPYDIFAGDFDNDGNLDVVTANNGYPYSFSYVAGNGNGTFQDKVDYATGDNPYAIFAGDFDNNGNLDVVVANWDSDTFSYFNGSGDGTFQSKVDYTAGAIARDILAGDFDNDGNLDVVVLAGPEDFAYFEGFGNGSFNKTGDCGLGFALEKIYAGDFDNDGNLDVVGADRGDDQIVYFPGNGNGSFNSSFSYAYAAGDAPSMIHGGDFDNDGNLDVVVVNEYSDDFSYLEGDGDGTFQGAVNYKLGEKPHSIFAWDFDDNGNLDVVVADLDLNMFSYFNGSGDGTFQGAVNYSALGDPYGIYAGDFDNDGNQDIVVSDTVWDRVLYYPGNGDGTFQKREGEYEAGCGTWKMYAGDFDNDNNLDLVTANRYSDDFSYLEGDGDGTFQGPVYYPAGNDPLGIHAGDFNNDGDLDVVVTNEGNLNFSYFAGNGDGTFQSRANYPAGNYPTAIHAADFDNNGNLDVVVANGGSDTFSYFNGSGDGTFQDKVDYPVNWWPYDINAGDFDNDGNMDVVVSDDWETIYYFAGNGTGMFNNTGNYTTGECPENMDVGDFDNDGNLDIVTSNICSDDFSYLEGNGDGTFQGAVNYSVVGPDDIFAGDLNNDGNLDVVVTDWGLHGFAYFKGNGDGTFADKVDYANRSSPSGMLGGDFDNDGDLDVVVSPWGGVIYFENNLSSNYPSNPNLDIGSDGSTEWSYTGELSTLTALFGANFVTELNSFLPACACPGCTSSGGGANCTIAFNFSSDTPGKLQLSDLAVQHAESE